MSEVVRIYAQWAGQPKGVKEDLTRCVQGVSTASTIVYQCSRKRGHGEDGLYCKQHAKNHPAK